MANGTLSQFSNHAQLATLNWAFTTGNPISGQYARPTAWYVGLSTTAPTSGGGGITEPSGNGYARQPVSFGAPSGDPGQCTNIGLVGFTANGGDWGTVIYGLIWDALTLGNVWALGPLAPIKLIQNGDTLQIQSGLLTVTQK